jgi:diguanylate cyclase (GGDEF)-like protein/PAS domain S-box-containing protein
VTDARGAREYVGVGATANRDERATAETLTLLETLQRKSPVGYGFVGRDMRLVRVNEALAAVNGGPIQQQLGRSVAEAFPVLWPQLESVYRGVLDFGESITNVELSGPTAVDSEDLRHWLASYYPVHLDGEIIGVGIVVIDITTRKNGEAALADRTEELARSNAELAEAQSIARVGSWELDLARSNIRWSRELYRVFGFALDEMPTYEALVERTHPDDRESLLQAHRVAVADLGPFVVEHRVLLVDGAVRWIRAQGRVELDSSGRAKRLLGTAQDVTEQKTAEDALQHHALHEPLTGLPNRLLLLDRLGHTLNRLARETSTVAVIHLDIDRFNLINESLGRDIGDQVLLAVSERLAELVRQGDTLAKLSGDEFVVLCDAVSGEAEAVAVAERLRAAVAEPLEWGGGHLVVSISAGIALTRSTLSDPDALLRDADAAMYRAKSQGRARTVVFAETMRISVSGRLDTEMALRQSITNHDLRVYYQPIVALVDGTILGHEALVRWAHPARGLLGPDQFIGVAEETGLIVPLGLWVLQESCRQARAFQARDPKWSQLTMSVNLSAVQLGQPDLVESVAAALADADLRPEHLQLEMTESVLMGDAAATIGVLARLKGLGISLGVDDFGTGYSSLAYLRRFPVDVLKIDQSFVKGLGDNLEDSAIVAAVVNLANTLDLTTIAEGVETNLQRDCLIDLGCVRAQGYLFSHPIPARDTLAALDDALPLGTTTPSTRSRAHRLFLPSSPPVAPILVSRGA